MPEQTSSYQTSISFSPFLEKRENLYRTWAFWGGIFTTVAVIATTVVAAAGLGFGWPLALAILGALFTAVSLFASYSHDKSTEKHAALTERKAREKELAKQQEIEKQIQKDKIIAKKMQMKEEEAQMEEAMKVVRTDGHTYIPNAQNNPAILESLQKTLHSTQLFNQSQLDATWRGIINISNNPISSSNIGFTKDGKISEIQINGGQIYKAISKKDEKELNNIMQI